MPSHYQYWLQIIDIHPRAISQNISKMCWQFFMHLSMVNELISKPCTSWVSVSYPMLAKSHVSMHDWAARAAKPDNWPSQLTKDWLSSIRLHCGTLCFIPGNGAHVCWIEEKYIVIHIYGITLNTAKSADQYYSSYSYQSSSLISYFMYNDLHHDCKAIRTN